jgi:hypothetical protein
MNLYVGIGRIADIKANGRVLKFTLDVQQERPCHAPCILFDPDDEVKKFMEELQKTKQLVWLQGRISSNEFEYQGKTIRRTEILTYANSIRTI